MINPTMGRPLEILLVEDNPGDARLIQEMLAEAAAQEISADFKMTLVARLSQAVAVLEQQLFDLILLDLSLPDSYGLETLYRILETSPELPVVVMSGLGDQTLALEAVKAGAQDYLMKGRVDKYSLPRAILYAIERKRSEEALRRRQKEMHRRNRELALLNQIIAALAADLEPPAILEIAGRELALIFDLPHATATLLDEAGAMATIVTEYRAIEGPGSVGLSFPVAEDPTFHYLRQDKAPLVADQAQQDQRLASIHTLLKQRYVISMLVLPLIIEGEVVGSLSLETFEPHTFSPEEINLARSVAGQVAGAMARARLTQTQQRLVAAIEQVTENIMITDIHGKIIYVNPAFERLTGYSPAEVLGQNPRMLGSGRQKPEFYREMWATISAGKIWQGRLTNRKKDGSLYIEDMTVTPVRDQEGVIINYVGVKRDVTRELQLEEQYHQAQKLEALGRLTGGIAHDFNNLLTAIIGFAELAYSEYSPDDPKQELMDKVLNSSRRAADLVRQLLIFSRKQVVELRLLNLNEIVSESNKMLERIIGEDVELRTYLASGLWPVKIDSTQMVQIILNLAVNARDAMPEGGQLTIETANIVLDEAYMATQLKAQPGEYVLLALSDTGVGMNKAVQDRIFEPFFTTKGTSKGTGLGLATIYGIVEQSKGSIWVYSEEGRGTTFKIYLPRATAEASLPAAAPAMEKISTGHETILLVEDNESVRSLFANVLEAQGYTMLTAADGQAALHLVESQTGPIDLLLSDIVMPHLNGKLLAEQLSQIYPDLKIIFMSGYTDQTVGDLPPEASFMQKPFSPMVLLRRVRQVLDRTF
jgi:PAS domain S-box-containing protein